MSEKKARYIGPSQTGVDLTIPFDNGDSRTIKVVQGGEVPTEIDGMKVPAKFRDGLLEQKDNWTDVVRNPKPDGGKEGDK